MTEHYNDNYYADFVDSSQISAQIIVSLISDSLEPKSVLDVGCGLGIWLREWQKIGVEIFGVDVAEAAGKNLVIPVDSFLQVNLEEPLNLNRKFDLVTCLEVAEHVSQESATQLIKSLVTHGDMVLFSAAIPFQGGVDHFNEQWPSYWEEIFKKFDFIALDPFRYKLWNNRSISFHYRQNMLLFVKNDKVENNSFLSKEHSLMDTKILNLVHPDQFVQVQDPDKVMPWSELKEVFNLFIYRGKRKLKKIF